MEEDCRIRPMINMLDSSTGGTAVRTEQRLKIGERLVGLLSSRENARKEFLSARGVEAALNALDEYDSKELAQGYKTEHTEWASPSFLRLSRNARIRNPG